MEPLNKAQKAAVEHGPGPLMIVAGAGSGKTRTLTSRLRAAVESGFEPESIVAITFTNKAAKEMRERVFGTDRLRHGARKEPFVGTFHSLGARLLREQARLAERTPHFTILDEDDAMSLVRRVVKNLNLPRATWPAPLIRSIISRVKNELGNPDGLDEVPRHAFHEYETELRRENAFDFDDLIEKPVRVLRAHGLVRETYEQRFRFVLVDEFQDVNAAQYELVKLLSRAHGNLSVVGDDAQSIYGFRGSDFRNFLNFERDWPGSRVVLLEQNYRSTDVIVRAASAVIARNKLQKPKELWTKNPAGSLIRVTAADDAEEEGIHVAERIRERLARPDAGSIAVLYRTNAQSRAIEQALIAERIPYFIFGGIRFYERKEVKDVMAALRFAANPHASVAEERLAKLLPKRTWEPLRKELAPAAKRLAPPELIAFFLERAEYHALLEHSFQNAEERKENVSELIRFAAEFNELDPFLESVSLLEATDAPRGERTEKTPAVRPHAKNLGIGVNLMTIHLAKGLEFDAVFLAGCAEGLLPHHRSFSSFHELEEERRLMYVAMTRARTHLEISFSDIPSRFLYEIPPELTEFESLSGRYGSLPDEETVYLE